MLTRSFSIASLLLILSSAGANAAGSGNIMRGGLGFLFPDHNSFVNPGQFAQARGMAIEAGYSNSTGDFGPQALGPSFVYGNGSVGFGTYGTRLGFPDLSNGYDVIGVGAGISLLKGRLSLGVGYDKVLGALGTDGDITTTLTFNPANRMGVSLGVGYTHSIDSSSGGFVAGLGYSFSGNNNLEVDFSFPDLEDFGNMKVETYFTMMRSFIYLSGGYILAQAEDAAAFTDLAAVGTFHGLAGRLGFMAGRTMDFSVGLKHYLGDGNPMIYNATFRAAF